MAKWIVTPETNKAENFQASISYGDNPEDTRYGIYQDVDKILAEVKADKELLAKAGNKNQLGWRKAFTIPDIVAIEIMENYLLDVHEPSFFKDKDKMKRLKYIIKTEYPYLLIST